MTLLQLLYFGLSSDLPENSELDRYDGCAEGGFFLFGQCFWM